MAWTEKYVSAAAGGGGDGSTGTPWTWAEGLANLAAGMRLNCLAGTYDLSGAGAQTISTTGPWIIQGYTTTPGDLGKFTLDYGTATGDFVTISGAQGVLRDCILKSTATSGNGDGLRLTGAYCVAERVVAYGWRDNGIETATLGGGSVLECETYDCNKSGAALKGGYAGVVDTVYIRCIAHDINTGDTDGHGFVVQATMKYIFIDCIVDTVGGYGIFLAHRSSVSIIQHCDLYNCVSGAINLDQSGYIPCAIVQNCNFAGNGGYDFRTVQAGSLLLIENCFTKAATSGRTSDAGKILDESSSSTYSAVPYTDAPNGNFVLDPTNGAAGRNAARTTFQQTQGYSGSTTSYRDVGAADHQDPAAGGASPRFGDMTGGKR